MNNQLQVNKVCLRFPDSDDTTLLVNYDSTSEYPLSISDIKADERVAIHASEVVQLVQGFLVHSKRYSQESNMTSVEVVKVSLPQSERDCSIYPAYNMCVFKRRSRSFETTETKAYQVRVSFDEMNGILNYVNSII